MSWYVGTKRKSLVLSTAGRVGPEPETETQQPTNEQSQDEQATGVDSQSSGTEQTEKPLPQSELRLDNPENEEEQNGIRRCRVPPCDAFF